MIKEPNCWGGGKYKISILDVLKQENLVHKAQGTEIVRYLCFCFRNRGAEFEPGPLLILPKIRISV